MIKRIKICYIVTKGNWGGAQKYVYQLAVNLPKETDVFVICGEGQVLKNKLEEKGVRVYELTNLKRNISFVKEYKSSLEILKIIYKEKPDVLHLNSPKASGFGSVAGRLIGVSKIIQTVHGWSFNEDRDIIATTLISFFSWLTVMFCHKTIVIDSKDEKQALAMPFVSKKKIVLIKNGIEVINYKEKNIARKELGVFIRDSRLLTLDSTLWLGTIAELHKNKGLKYAIEAVSKINPVRDREGSERASVSNGIKTPFFYFILGGGEEKKELESLIEKYNLQDKVFLIGFVENAMEYLKAFDIFILTSIKEGLPYTLLEAGGAGLPCISTNVGGIPDIIDTSVNGILVGKGRSGEITRALEYIIENPSIAKTFGKNLKQKVEKDFSLEQMLGRTKKLYDN